MIAGDRLRFVFQSIAEGLIFTLLFCVLGVLTLQLTSGPEVVEDPPAAVPSALPGSGP